MDPKMNNLLKWSIANSSNPSTNPSTDPTAPTDPNTTHLSPSALTTLLGGPSDADLMRTSLSTITSPTTPTNPLANKLTAFDNLEQLIESIDNANNLEPLGLWTPLVAQLSSEEPELRRMAAWCVGTAVQNNGRAQERLLALNAIPTLVRMAMEDGDEGVRRKAIYALSSGMRNYQPATDEAVKALPREFVNGGRVRAGDMEAIDGIMDKMRERAGQRQTG